MYNMHQQNIMGLAATDLGFGGCIREPRATVYNMITSKRNIHIYHSV